MKKCPDFFKTERICLKAGVSMGIGFSSAEECVWKGLAACHWAEEKETHAHYYPPLYCLLSPSPPPSPSLRLPFALWYPSSLLPRNPFVISPWCWLSRLHSPCAWALLAPPVCSSWCQRDDRTPAVCPPEPAATCVCWGWPEGSGEAASDVLTQLAFPACTVCQHNCFPFQESVLKNEDMDSGLKARRRWQAKRSQRALRNGWAEVSPPWGDSLLGTALLEPWDTTAFSWIAEGESLMKVQDLNRTRSRCSCLRNLGDWPHC